MDGANVRDFGQRPYMAGVLTLIIRALSYYLSSSLLLAARDIPAEMHQMCLQETQLPGSMVEGVGSVDMEVSF